MKREAEENAEADKKIKEEIETLNSADTLIFQTEKSLKDFEGKISEEQKNKIETLINDLREKHSSKDIGAIKISMETLIREFQSIVTEMYANASQETTVNETE